MLSLLRQFISYRPIVVYGILFGLAACRAESVASSSPRPSADGPKGFKPERSATLFFTTGLSGYIEPCGCTSKPLGGLSRLATTIAKEGSSTALIDAGHLFLPKEELDAMTRPQHVAKAKLIARAFRKLGAVAINLTPPDLKEGAKFLAELQREGAVPLVSANIRPRAEDGPRVARARVRIVGGIRIGITGIAIPEIAAKASDEVAALEFAPALRSEVESLREDGAEIVVVLAHLPEPDAKLLAQAVPDIDLLIRSPGSDTESIPMLPAKVGPVVLAEAGTQGQYVGRVRVAVGTGAIKRPLAFEDGGARAMADRARLEKRIAAYDREIARYELDPTKKALIPSRVRMRAQLKARLNRPVVVPAVTPGPRMEVSLVPIETSIAEDDSMKQMLAAYYQTLREMNLSRGDPAACQVASDEDPRYVGTAKCGTCHPQALEFWKTTQHAHAWATLEREARHYDFTCVGCHSVGFRKPGGFCVLTEAGPYRNVGCENCHGPGSRHVVAPSEVKLDRAATKSTCIDSCHVPEHSDAFVYETYLRKITGPGHPRSVGE